MIVGMSNERSQRFEGMCGLDAWIYEDFAWTHVSWLSLGSALYLLGTGFCLGGRGVAVGHWVWHFGWVVRRVGLGMAIPLARYLLYFIQIFYLTTHRTMETEITT